MANPLKLPFDFPPNAIPATHQLQANFNALLQFVQDLNDAVISLNSLLVNTLTSVSTVTSGGLITGNNGVQVNNAALDVNSTADISGTLDVTGNIAAASTLSLANGSAAAPSLRFSNSTTTGAFRAGVSNLGLSTDGVKAVDIDATQNHTLPVQPSFLAQITTAGANQFGDGPAYTIDWETEVLDRSGAFNMTTNTFTAAVSGVYAFVVFVDASSVDVGTITPTLTLVTSNQSYYNNLPAYTTASVRGISVVYTYMDANDTCSVTIAGDSLLGTKTADIDFAYFAGFLFG